MVNHFAFGVLSACAYARVDTALVATRLVEGALCADGALGAASRRCTDIVWSTRTRCLTIHIPALAVRSARRWLTWIYLNRI